MIGTIDIHRPDGSALATIIFDAASYRRWQVMGEHAVTLIFSLPQPANGLHSGFLEIPVGSYITLKGHRYTLYNPSDFTKNGNRNYEYTLKLYAYQELTYDRIFINEPDMRQVFSRQARPEEFLSAIVRNMNHFDTGDWDGTEWTVGQCITSNVQQLIQFNGVSVAEALRLVASAFKTEWEINNKVISLRKVEYNKETPLALSYGQGNGFKPGLGRGNFDQSRPVHKLYVTGGDRNIEFKTYGSQTLLLPKNKTIHFDGTYFEDETGYNSAVAREYQTSADGTNLVRVDVPQTSRREAFIELTEAYPKRIGTITDIVWIYGSTEYADYDDAVSAAVAGGSDAGSVFCDVFDTSIPDDLNYALMRIPSEQMVFVPQTGRLSGVELSVQQGEKDASDGYIHSERRFKLITESDYGGFIPDGRLAVGDTYALFGMQMPQTYIAIGERDLLKEAVRYKYENEELRFTFKGDMDGIWAQKNWDAIEDKIVAGGYVLFSDPQFQPEGKLIRISAIKEYLVEPYKPELELTNIVIGRGLRGELAEIPKQEVVINESIRNITNLSTRQWRDKEELRRGLARLHLGYTEGITPITVQAMQLVAGSEQLQFRFVNSKTTPTAVNPVIVYDPTANTLSVQAGIIQHMTLGIDAISATHDVSEYKFWNVDALTTGPLEEDKLYWLYARVPKTGNANGTFVVTTEEMPFDTDSAYYNLLVGALNSEYGGTRAFAPLYGFTEILPGRITTDRIVSQDGLNFLDLIGNALRIGNGESSFEWNTAGSEQKLRIVNADMQIGTDPENPLVQFDGQDGSGHVAGGNLAWNSEGDVTIRGAISNPFDFFDLNGIGGPKISVKDHILTALQGNTVIDLPDLEWNLDSSGRHIHLVNYKWQGQEAQSGYSLFAPSGYSFFEDGVAKQSIAVGFEYVELMGIGDDTTFFGWQVVNRKPIMYVPPVPVDPKSYVLVAGTIDADGVVSNQWGAKTIRITKTGTGQYQLLHTIGHTNYFITATPSGLNNTWRQVHIVIEAKETDSVTLSTRDSVSGAVADFDFDFLIAGKN